MIDRAPPRTTASLSTAARISQLLVSALLLLGVAGCSPTNDFIGGGESHFGKTAAFLRLCEDGSCESGDTCSCAVCTVGCSEVADCAERILGKDADPADLPPSVQCRVPACGVDPALSGDEGPSGAAGDSVCDVVCETDADCAFLDEQARAADQTVETEHFCQAGYCRTLQEPDEPDPNATAPVDVCPAGRLLVPGVAAPDGIGLCMDTTEVTVAQYRSCVEAGDCLEPAAGNFLTAMRDDHPVNFVSLEQAGSYCAFASGRLPSQQEWTSAASGGETLDSFPWGDQLPDASDMPDLSCGLDETATCVVASFPEGDGPYGHSDLAGNVAELVSIDTGVCAAGGSYESEPTELTATSCVTFDAPAATVGFRCLSDL